MRKRIVSILTTMFLAMAALAANPVQDVFFELTRYCLRGVSELPVSPEMADFSRPAAEFFVRPVWRERRFYPLYLAEILYPEKCGVLDSTFSSADLLGVVEQGDSSVRTDWVDSVLLAVKMRASSKTQPESFDVAEQMLSQMDNKDDGGIVEGAESDGDEPVEASYTDSAGHLRRFSFGAEQFSLREKDGVRTTVDAAEGLVIRRFFDEQNLIQKKESFKVGTSARALQFLSSREYAYRDGEAIPHQMTEDVTAGNLHTVTTYNDRGLALRVEAAHYVYPEKKKKKKEPDPPRLVKDKTSLWDYDEKNRVVQEEHITYLYSKTATGKEKIDTDAIKKKYSYNGKSSRPDVSYYENNVLRMRTVYQSENVYNETMYFDDGFTVLAYYENNVKRLEIVSIAGVELRRKSFEK